MPQHDDDLPGDAMFARISNWFKGGMDVSAAAAAAVAAEKKMDKSLRFPVFRKKCTWHVRPMPPSNFPRGF